MNLQLIPSAVEHAETFLRWRNEPNTLRFNPVKSLTLDELRTGEAALLTLIYVARADGTEPRDHPVTPGDLVVTILSKLGIPAEEGRRLALTRRTA